MHTFRALSTLFAVIVLASGLAGCGKKGSLETPSAEAKTEEKSDGEKGKGKEKTASTIGKEKENKPSQWPTGPHKPFILDGLLR
ncbi:MAG: lipoprotein [Hyphomicrobiales bacterium]|nr:lipoprotein [Hyphomicrobiales bacterium]